MDEGNKLPDYATLFELVGTCAEPFLPYDPNPKHAAPGVPDELKRYLELAQITEQDLEAVRDGFGKYGFAAGSCTVLDESAARDVQRLQKALDGGLLAIPVTYPVHGPNWSAVKRDAATGRTFLHPGLLGSFREAGTEEWMDYGKCKLLMAGKGIEFVAAAKADKVEIKLDEDPKQEIYGGHAVTIVGYDDRGFLIKNSWGENWGDRGYATILYDYHAVFATGALLITDARIRMPSLSPFEQRARIERGTFRLKVQPRGTGGDARLVLSTWMLEPRDANVEVVEYTVEGRTTDATWKEVHKEVVAAGALERRRGCALVVPTAKLAGLQGVRVTVRYGDLPLGDVKKPAEIRWLATHSYPEFAPVLPSAQDFAPVR
ncbi:MAG: C1 family peptidase [Planctomycetes bacterium]|nr:C1 family peptidase [Planctomycetota bacterium]